VTKSNSTPGSARGPENGAAAKPSMRDRLRPLELLGISLVLAVFAGLITAFTTRDWMLAGIVAGAGFIVVVVALAMLALGSYEPQRPPVELEAEAEGDGQPSPH